jgi:hypothetical protein
MTYIPTDDGRWVSEHFERLARVIQDYDPQFALCWIPPEHRLTPDDRRNCYAVMDTITNTVVFHAGELDTPESILSRLFDSDNKHGNVLERIDAHNAAVKAMQMKEQMDKAEERQEIISWLIGTDKNFIDMGNGRVVDDQLRTVRRGHGNPIRK